MNDLKKGSKIPDNWKFYPFQTDGGTIYPVQHHGDTGGWTYAVRPNDELITQAFRFASGWSSQPSLDSTLAVLFGGLTNYRESIHYQGNNLYLAAGIKQADRIPFAFPERWNVRGLKVPITDTSSGWLLGPCPSSACLDFNFGTRGPGDGSDDLWSYEMGSMAVNDSGDMAIVFGRVPLIAAAGRGQEARYLLYYNDSRGEQSSNVLQEGDVVLKDKYCSGGVTEPVETTENYWHVWYGNDGCTTQSDYQDYGTAVADPEGNFWFAHSFADSTLKTFRMVGGKVKP